MRRLRLVLTEGDSQIVDGLNNVLFCRVELLKASLHCGDMNISAFVIEVHLWIFQFYCIKKSSVFR